MPVFLRASYVLAGMFAKAFVRPTWQKQKRLNSGKFQGHIRFWHETDDIFHRVLQ